MLLSVIIPVYNEEAGLSELFTQLIPVLVRSGYDYEILFVDDGSRDASLDVLRRLAKKNKKIKVLSFSRNFGHQVAVSAGMDHARGDLVAIMDADLQDSPEVLLELLLKQKEGFDVVYARRRSRGGESAFKLWTAHWFYRILNLFSEIQIPHDTGDFRVFTRRVLKALLSMPERDRFLRGLISWTGFKQTYVFFDRKPRFAGETGYPLLKMLRFAMTGISSFSVMPLQFANYLGLVFIVLSFCYGVYVMYLRFFTEKTVQGWSSLVVLVLGVGAVQMFILGIIGTYLGRIHQELKRRPLYLLAETVNLEGPSQSGRRKASAVRRIP